MDRFIELMARLPLGTMITMINKDIFHLYIPPATGGAPIILSGEDPITLLEQALKGVTQNVR